MHLWCLTFWSLNRVIKIKPINKARDTLNVMQMAPLILQPKRIRAFTGKTWESTRPFRFFCPTPSVVPQASGALVSPSRGQWHAERMELVQDISSAKGHKSLMNEETFHYWPGCRLLLGKADVHLQSLGCAHFSSTPLRMAQVMQEQHPGLGTPARHPWAEAHLQSAQNSAPWWWCW